ncbi:MAG TPA: PEP/pyruvate-binding domain-containing protein [Syntrophobacteraceae bacterium]|nr:PEP/pyruvate-binding domain-containing protein [Syntrophobacteraceae bacterium]
MLRFLDFFRKGKALEGESPEQAAFRKKYQHFENLLAANNKALELMTELEQTCYGPKPFSLEYVIGQTESLLSYVNRIADELNALSNNKFVRLFDAVERIGVSVLQELVRKRTVEAGRFTLPMQDLSLERLAEVGGKAASLGEVYNRVHLPVPRGFAITAYACSHFMHFNRLYEESERVLKGLDVEDTEKLLECSRKIQSLILDAPLPPDLENAVLNEVDSLIRELGPDIRMAVRSSATCEDSEASFAGQHSSVLGVGRSNFLQAYKEVVASTFNPRAIYYRRSKGYPDEYVIMSVLCLVMVNAKSSGVLYTRDPNDPRRDVILVNGVWGLGVSAVEGSAATDFFVVDKARRQILSTWTAPKETMLVLADPEGLEERKVPPELRTRPSLESDQLLSLAEAGILLEEHYGQPLDIEWALDSSNRIVLLQSRPLNVDLKTVRGDVPTLGSDLESLRRKFPDNPILLHQGVTASRGKASGIAYVLTSDHNLLNIPVGSILIAKQTSPRYVSILGRVQAIVTDVGSITGHMASVAREFGVPTLVGTGNATEVISHGEEITVDATNCLIFQGRVESILERKKAVNPMKGSPTYKACHAALKKMAVLNLTDPENENFSPDGCRTVHDVVRFAHEMSMREMFRISDRVEMDKRYAVRIKAPLPMKILAVDLQGGLNIPPGASEATMEQVTSIPFQALLRGMTHPDVRWVGAVGVDWRGFATIMAESVFRDPTMDDRMGGPNYVVLSNEYFNFNSRLGYHFAVIDAYCGPQVNDNYVAFSFKGGAADIGRRSRRALLIAKILKRLGLKTTLKGDMVRGEIKKYDCSELLTRLDMLGRLIGAVRLLDMVLSDDGRIDWYVDEFFNGNYSFQRKAQGTSGQ